MTAADHEFIYLGLGDVRKDKENASIMARKVARMIQVFDPSTEEYDLIRLEIAELIKPDLLMAMCNATDDAIVEPETVEEAAKN